MRQQVLGPVGVALVVLDLEQAQELVAKPDRMNHQGQHVGRGTPPRRGRSGVLRTSGSPGCMTSCRSGTISWGGSRRFGRPTEPGRAREMSRSLHPVHPEVAPIEQPVGQPLDLGERSLKGGVAGDSRLHQVNLVQILGADRLIQDLPGEQTQHPEGQRHGDPADRAPAFASAATTMVLAIRVSR